MRRVRRSFVVGDEKSPPKRIRIDVLERLVHQLRETVDTVAKDLCIEDSEVQPVELVDLGAGSSILVWEQSSLSQTAPFPLSMAIDGITAISKGRPPHAILTERARRSIDDLAKLCASLGREGCPIRVDDASQDASESTDFGEKGRDLVLVQSELSILASGTAQAVETTGPPEEEEPTIEQGEWILRFTGEVQRLSRDRKLSLQIGESVKSLKPRLSEHEFAAADSDLARWKRVEVTALGSGPTIESITEVLSIVPATTDVPLEAEPKNAAAAALQPALDRIGQLASLPQGWNSYEQSRPIDSLAMDAARKFLLLAAVQCKSHGQQLTVPFIAPVANGAVQLEWDHGEVHLELEIRSRGMVFMRAIGDLMAEGETAKGPALDLVKWFHEEAFR